MSTKTWLDLALIAVLLLACVFDLGWRRIPNRLLALALLVALGLHLGSGNVASVVSTGMAGFGIGMLMFLPLYLLRAMAAGDVKLMATVGAFLGPSLAFQAVWRRTARAGCSPSVLCWPDNAAVRRCSTWASCCNQYSCASMGCVLARPRRQCQVWAGCRTQWRSRQGHWW